MIKICAYIDGFNLYYSARRGTEYKWLDVSKLCMNILRTEEPLVTIKYFTARILHNPNDPEQHRRQEVYFRALRTLGNVEMYFGQFKERHFSATTIRDGTRIKVKKYAEKGADVNLAVHLVNDWWAGCYDRASDCE